MLDKFDIIYNSENGSKSFQIASGYISETTVLFENENIYAVIEAKGTVEFFNTDGILLAKCELPPVGDGKGKYQEVCLTVENKLIVLDFPLYKWIDNYPHCDGEHDRWDTVKIGCNTVTFDLENYIISM